MHDAFFAKPYDYKELKESLDERRLQRQGRGEQEDVLKFLGKEQNKKVLEYLMKGYKAVEISKIT